MKKLFASIAIAGALISTHGFAQEGPGHGWHGRKDPARMEQMVNKKLSALKEALKITPAQESAWNTFAATMKPPTPGMDKRPEPAELEKLALPQRIDALHSFHTQHMATMNAHMEKRDNAMKALYATLSAEQQKIANAEHMKMLRHMEHRM